MCKHEAVFSARYEDDSPQRQDDVNLARQSLMYVQNVFVGMTCWEIVIG